LEVIDDGEWHSDATLVAESYGAIKAVSPQTRVLVIFRYEEMVARKGFDLIKSSIQRRSISSDSPRIRTYLGLRDYYGRPKPAWSLWQKLAGLPRVTRTSPG